MPRKSNAGSADWTDEDDAPVLTESEAAEIEVFHGEAFVARRGRGRPKTGNAKELISVRLDPEVLGELRRAGPGWQSQVNVLLRQGLGLSEHDAAKSEAIQVVLDGAKRVAAIAAEAVVIAESETIRDVMMEESSTRRKRQHA